MHGSLHQPSRIPSVDGEDNYVPGLPDQDVVMTVDGKRRMRVWGGMVHLVDLLSVGRGYSRCGLFLRAAHGAWVSFDTALTCLTCLMVDEPYDVKNPARLYEQR